MKRAAIAFGMLLMTASAANAGGLVTKHASSVQLTVDAARSTASRIGFQAYFLRIKTSKRKTTDVQNINPIPGVTKSNGFIF